MSRVKEGYLENKREEILDYAFNVCNRKPVYDVTMSDIVAETGMSQGGVYKYFSNIDEVFAAIIDRSNKQGTHTKQIEEIMNSDLLPEQKVKNLYEVSESYFSKLLIGYNKVLFELGTFFAQNEEKRERIQKQVTTTSVFEELIQNATLLIMQETQKGYFHPMVPVEDILSYVIISFDGIIRDVTLTRCYPRQGQEGLEFDEHKLIHCLYVSTMVLLGMDVNRTETNEER